MDNLDQKKLDRFEKRRQKLLQLIRTKFDGINANLAKQIGYDQSYINRCLYPQDKKYKKNIGDELMCLIIDELGLPEDFWTQDENITLEKMRHIEEIKRMTDEEFKSKEGIFNETIKIPGIRKNKE